MKQRNFELLCAAMLGFGQLCIMVGYDSESFILESVIHSIHERDPEKVSQYAGYYGQAVIFCAYMTGCLFAPSILHVTTPKILLIFSAISYTLFPFGFLFFNTYFYFFTAILLGVGTSFYYLGMGSYLSQHSTRETIESNVSISWSVGCCCLMLGAGILAGITSLSVPEPTTVIQNATFPANESHTQHERRYSENEIRLLSAAFSGMSAIAIVTFAMMPSKSVENSLESTEKKFGFMESLMGILISALSKRIKGFGLKPTMVIGAISVIIYCGLVHISTPFEAPMRPTSEKSIWIGQSYPLIFIIAIFCGISDCCINGVRSVICALVLPQRRAQSFAVTRMYHAAACMTCFFFSPIVPLYIYTSLLPILSIFSTFLFFRVVDKTHSMERKITQQVMDQKLENLKNQNIVTVA
ncbi:hypothetical protein B9Z55_021707 [Caenorhabditis nigoni]|uniref:Major facilitator superfamily (MFS) profile domain-containing protein n=1 Tax=Caenorhabditis nigoni TaxID=1611254 RepID=A0A2G5TT79_9PELO|nr:hypothetical protein B9Z55_021707 [Caenorhabditis nigoni]